MTDRGADALSTSRDTLRIGPSAMRWTGTRLEIELDERGAPPVPRRVRGRVTVTPTAVTDRELLLSPDGAHVWRPYAPAARMEVEMNGVRWSGHGYLDGNFGTRPLEDDFSYWTWGRFPIRRGATCFYEAVRRDGTEANAALAFDAEGGVTRTEAPPRAPLPPTLWRVRRATRADAGYAPRQVCNMLDSPFYSRASVRTRIDGEETVGMHEALDLDRFRSPLIKPMVAMRVPRRGRWRPRAQS
ncbi:hydroxyneurosporene synthase [Tranquillimonas alkanivorans]|uniref:Hydroxyneurosporene synthase n=2 Tax=Tranquillimonas alkanivorans TaxID=441119 RepID=A0A1I5LED4_9RHOB|nr:hydroxyneurosporene synthase [Tranquillimonas alkanivorans]